MATLKQEQKKTTGRISRTPINGPRNILTVSGIDTNKFHPCWVNDIDDNVNKYLDAGYDFVTTDGDVVVGDRQINRDSQIGAKISKNVGNNTTAYLMVIPKEYYDEDMKAYNDDLDEKENTWKSGLKQSVEGSYGSIKIDK
jgi:hypothetical protein